MHVLKITDTVFYFIIYEEFIRKLNVVDSEAYLNIISMITINVTQQYYYKVQNMEVEEPIITTKSFNDLIKDQSIKQKVIKILIQTLYNLGYHQSAEKLQKQSSITYYHKHLLNLRQHILQHQFQAAKAIIHSIQLKENDKKHVLVALSELQCLHYIEQGNINKSMTVLKEWSIDFDRTNQLCQKLIFGQFLNENNTDRKQELMELIIEKCSLSNIQPRSMEKMILLHMQLQKEGLVQNIKNEYLINTIQMKQHSNSEDLEQCQEIDNVDQPQLHLFEWQMNEVESDVELDLYDL